MRFKASFIMKNNFCGRKWCKLFSNYLTAIEDDDCHERALTASTIGYIKGQIFANIRIIARNCTTELQHLCGIELLSSNMNATFS